MIKYIFDGHKVNVIKKNENFVHVNEEEISSYCFPSVNLL